MAAVENHYPWVEVVQSSGANSVRAHAAGRGTPEEIAEKAIDDLARLGTFGVSRGTEYKGNQLSEGQGIKATEALLEKVFKEPEYIGRLH